MPVSSDIPQNCLLRPWAYFVSFAKNPHLFLRGENPHISLLSGMPITVTITVTITAPVTVTCTVDITITGWRSHLSSGHMTLHIWQRLRRVSHRTCCWQLAARTRGNPNRLAAEHQHNLHDQSAVNAAYAYVPSITHASISTQHATWTCRLRPRSVTCTIPVTNTTLTPATAYL